MVNSVESGTPVCNILSPAVLAVSADPVGVNMKLPAFAVQKMFLSCLGAPNIPHGDQATITPGKGQLPLARGIHVRVVIRRDSEDMPMAPLLVCGGSVGKMSVRGERILAGDDTCSVGGLGGNGRVAPVILRRRVKERDAKMLRRICGYCNCLILTYTYKIQ